MKGLMFHLNELRRLSPLGTAEGATDRRAVPGHVLHSFPTMIMAPTTAEIKGSDGGLSSAGAGAGAGAEADEDMPCAPLSEVIPVRFVPSFSYGFKRVRASQVGLDPEAEALLFARQLLFSFVADSSSRSYAPAVGAGASGTAGKK